MATTCQSCGGPLAEIPAPEGLADLYCRTDGCKMRGVNQHPRYMRGRALQLGFGSHGVRRFERGRPSQGEDNCIPVAKCLLARLGDRYQVRELSAERGPARDAREERGFDFALLHDCGHETEVQVTRVPEEAHFRALRQGQVIDERRHGTLIHLLCKAIWNKTNRTSLADRGNRILAIDGRSYIGFQFFLTSIQFDDLADAGWQAILLVDEFDYQRLDREGQLECPRCHHIPSS
jgi:hypothetical protein